MSIEPIVQMADLRKSSDDRCQACEGEGFLDGYECAHCQGTGLGWEDGDLPPVERDPVAIALGLMPEIDDEEVMQRARELRLGLAVDKVLEENNSYSDSD